MCTHNIHFYVEIRKKINTFFVEKSTYQELCDIVVKHRGTQGIRATEC